MFQTDISDQELVQFYTSSAQNTEIRLGTSDPLGLVRQLPQNFEPKVHSINSKQFNATRFLRDIHADDTFEELNASLDYLEKSLVAQSEDLKQMVQHEFVKFVRSKNALDSVFEQFTHAQITTDKLSSLVDDIIAQGALLLKPVMDLHTNKYDVALQFIQQHKFWFDLPHKIQTHWKSGQYEKLVSEYKTAKHLKLSTPGPTTPALEKIWGEVENTMDMYRQQTWSQLMAGDDLSLVDVLRDIGSDEDPLKKWAESRMERFEQQIIAALPEMPVVPESPGRDETDKIEQWLIRSSKLEKACTVISDFIEFIKKSHAEPSQFITKMSTYLLRFDMCVKDSNGIMSLRYLKKILQPLMVQLTRLGELKLPTDTLKEVRETANIIMERSLAHIANTMVNDIVESHSKEDWKLKNKCTSFVYYVEDYFMQVIPLYNEVAFLCRKMPSLAVLQHPSDKLMAGFETQFIRGLESVLEAVLKNAVNTTIVQSVLTLNNLEHLKTVTFPKVTKLFDEHFETSLQSKKLALYALLDKMSSSILLNLNSDLKLDLRTALQAKFELIDWSTMQMKRAKVDDYIFAALMPLVDLHSEIWDISPGVFSAVAEVAVSYTIAFILECFRNVKLSNDAKFQMIVDLSFYQKTLGSYITPETKKECLDGMALILNTSNLDKYFSATDEIVKEQLDTTKVQFAVLSSS